MSIDWALTPISDASPCGPNLDTTDDPDFVEYYFDALGRLPERYVTPGMETEKGMRTEDRVFDPKTIKISDENKQIDAMLRRSRDIRLLALKAQFECLAGRIEPMAEAFETVADLLERFGEDVHPTLDNGPSDRRDALHELTQPMTIVTALQYIGLSGTTEATLRRIKVATGQAKPNTGEDDLSESMIRGAIGSPSNKPKVDATHAALVKMTHSLDRISRSCKTNPSTSFTPNFDGVLRVLAEMRAVITESRPDLYSAEADMALSDVEEPETVGSDAPQSADTAGQAVASPALVDLPPGAFNSHAEARQALITCEVYFRNKEPSSAAVLLITQARLLIGKPLIEAMEILLPDHASRAIVNFGPTTGFALPIARLKALSNEAPGTAPPQPDPAEAGPPPVVTNASEAASVLRGVEEFFRRHERSSPVPMILQRARTYLEKDFQALIDELIPKAPAQS